MSRYLTSALVVATFVGLLAGATSGVLAALWIVPRVTISEPRSAGAVVEFPTTTTPGMLAQTVAPAAFVFLPPKAFRPLGPGTAAVSEAIIGRAVAMTSDGWIAFDAAVAATGMVALSGSGETAPVRKVTVDPGTGLAFAKLEGLPGLPSLPLARGAAAASGEPLYAVTARGEIAPLTIMSDRAAPTRPEDAVTASEMYSRRILVFPALGKAARGTPVFDRDGSLYGILSGDRGDRVIPIAAARPAFTALVRTGALRRPYLGVRGVALADLAGLDATHSRRGVFLLDTPGRPAVRPGSPAALAGLASGDIILEIEGDSLGPGELLAEALADYRPGEEVRVRFRRGAADKEASVVLGDTAEVR